MQDSDFRLSHTKFFLKQFKELTEKEKDLVNSKLDILKQNPFRYKKLNGYKNTFEIKITLNQNYSRLIYATYMPEKNYITIFGIFKRKDEFKDFKRYLENNF